MTLIQYREEIQLSKKALIFYTVMKFKNLGSIAVLINTSMSFRIYFEPRFTQILILQRIIYVHILYLST